MIKVIFLDRDGVISIDKGYNHKIEDFELEKNIIPALKLLKKNGFSFIVVTNQSGIGRGIYTEDDFWKYNNCVTDELSKNGIEILKTYFSPYHPEKGIGKYKKKTRCRKPEPGMLEEAEKDFGIDNEHSWIIGDKWSDVKTGKNFGIKAILVLTGHAGDDAEKHKTEVEFIAQDPLDAAEFIIRNENS
ncbi:MAG: HAD family hydrolase [Candidatus Moranbacteria bacterium]|nr:HAD family hydrolase [Candidatus Moranbacteria bacterium]